MPAAAAAGAGAGVGAVALLGYISKHGRINDPNVARSTLGHAMQCKDCPNSKVKAKNCCETHR